MGVDWRGNVVLYWGQQVVVTRLDGTCLEGELEPDAGERLALRTEAGSVYLPWAEVADVRMIGRTQDGVSPNGLARLYGIGSCRGDYVFPVEEAAPSARESLRYGEFECELVCHLEVDERQELRARDVRLRRRWHLLFRSCLEEQVFLYKLQGQPGYVPALLVPEGEEPALELLDGRRIPLRREEIEDVTRCPKAGDIRVQVELLDGARYEGTVTTSLEEFFMLGLEKDGRRIFYREIKGLRFYGQLVGNQYNKKYSPVSAGAGGEPPQAAHYTVGVTAGRLIAKDYSPAPLTAPGAQDALGLLFFTRGKAYICQEYKPDAVAGDIWVPPQWRGGFDPGTIYLVRYREGVKRSQFPLPPADRVEKTDTSFAEGAYKRIWLDETGTVQTENRYGDQDPYAPDYWLQEMPEGCGLWVRTEEESVYGHLLGADGDTLRLQVGGVERSFPVEALTQVRGFGEVSWVGERGTGFIHSDVRDGLFFHIQQSRDKKTFQVGQTVSFRLKRGKPDNDGTQRPAADDTVLVEERKESRQVLVDSKGRCRLLGTELLFSDKEEAFQMATPPATPRPALYEVTIKGYWEAATKQLQCQWMEGDWGEAQPLEWCRLEDLEKPVRQGVAYRYGLACLAQLDETYRLQIKRAHVNAQWSQARYKAERAWDRSVFWDAGALKANADYKDKLLLLRYVLAPEKVENPISPKGPLVSVVDGDEPPVVLWCSEEPATAYQFAALQDGALVYLRKKTAGVESGGFFKQAKKLAEAAGESETDLRARLAAQMALGNWFYDREDRATAGKYYRDWRGTHRLLCERFPEQKNSYANWERYIQGRLETCGADHGVYAQAEVRRLLEAAETAALGTGAVTAFDQAMRAYDFSLAQTLLNRLSLEREAEDCPCQTCWAMARCYQRLWERAANPAVTKHRDRWLIRALLAQARETDDRERRSYLCLLAVRVAPNDKAVHAPYLAAALSPEDTPLAVASLADVLERAGAAWGEALPAGFLLDSLALFSARGLSVQSQTALVRALEGLGGYRDLLLRYLGQDGEPGAAMGNLVDRACQSFSSRREALFTAAETGAWERVIRGLETLLEQLGRADSLKGEGAGLVTFLSQLESIAAARTLRQRMDAFETCLQSYDLCAQQLSKEPTCLVDEVLAPVLERSGGFLAQGYQELCVTTRPVVRISGGDMLGEGVDAEGRLRLRVNVQIKGGAYQTAGEPRLQVRASEEFTLAPGTGPILPLGDFSAEAEDKTVGFEFWVIPADPKSEDVTVQARLTYRYRNGVPGPDGQYGNEAEAVVPAPGEYQTVTVSMDGARGRAPIDDGYIGQFALTGVGAYALAQAKNEGLRELLRNREEDVCYICDNLHKRWIILQGQWRVGKTTVLNLVAHRKSAETCCVVSLEPPGYLDGTDYEQRFVERLFTELVEEAGDAPEGTLWQRGAQWLDEQTPPTSLEALSGVLDRLMKELGEGAELLFLVDEFTRLYDLLRGGRLDGDFLCRWARFALNDPQVAVITAGGEFTRDMVGLYAPNEYQKACPRTLEYLDEDKVEAFLRYVVHDERYFKPSTQGPAVKKLYELTQGNVFLLVKVCELLINYINQDIADTTTPNTRCYITDGLILEAIRDQIKTYDFNEWFGFLSNPYNLKDDKTAPPAEDHLDDVGVREDNEKLLKTFARLAAPDTLSCSEGRLLDELSAEGGEADRTRWKKRVDALVGRKVMLRLEGSHPTLKVRIGLLCTLEWNAERAQK